MLDPNMFRLILFFSILTSLYFCESVWARRGWETSHGLRWVVHGMVSIFNTFFGRLVVVPPLLFLLAITSEKGWGLARVLGLAGPLEIVVTLVLFDALDYWWHRLNHEWPFLWRFHRVHHLDTHVDVTTSLRFHPGELFLSGIAKGVWILMWGPSLWGFMIFEAGITAYSQFHHANIDFPDGVERVLRLIHMTPRLHTTHHTVSLRTRDANYSTIFLWWDRMFFTFREPDQEEMKQLGLPEGRETYLSLWKNLVSPFVAH